MAELCPHCTTLPAVSDAFCPDCGAVLVESSASPPFEVGGLHGDVWYATERRVFGWRKLSWYDDRGVVAACPEGLLFCGQGGVLKMARVSAVGLVGPVVPWLAVALLALGNVLLLLLCRWGAFHDLSAGDPLTVAVLGLCNLFAVSAWPLRWVKVDYQDDQGQQRTAYFTVASVTGRWAGGAQRLCALLEQHAGRRPAS